YTGAGGAALDYESILNGGEFTATLGTTTLTLSAPTPIAMQFDANFAAQATPVTAASQAALIAKLKADGIARFRYYIENSSFAFTPGQLTITFAAAGWQDAGGNPGPAGVFLFGIDGPTAHLVGPAN